MRDPYEVLGVARTASLDEIKTAYRRLAREHHPDVNPDDPTAEERFKEIGAAYDILSDQEKRAKFDRFGSADGMQGPFMDGNVGGFADLFDMFFGGAGGGQSSRKRTEGRDGDDLKVTARIALADVITGVRKEIRMRKPSRCSGCTGTGVEGGGKPETCNNCKGSGSVTQVRQTFIGQVRTSAPCNICRGEGFVIKNPCKTCHGNGVVPEEVTVPIDVPPGVEHGLTIRYSGQGGDPTGQGVPGDLFVQVHIANDARYERHGQDILTELQLTFAQASLGDEITVPGLDQDFEIEVPAGTQPAQILTIKGAGLPPLHGGRRGDLHLRTTVVVPKKVTEAQAHLLREYAEVSGEPIPKGEPNSGLFGNLFKKKK